MLYFFVSRLLLPYEKYVRNQLKKQMDEKNPSAINSLAQKMPLNKSEKRQGLTVSNTKPGIETDKTTAPRQNHGVVKAIPPRFPQDNTAVSSLPSSPYRINTTSDAKGNVVKTTNSSQVHSVTASAVNKASFKQGMPPVALQSIKQDYQESKTWSNKSKTSLAPPITSSAEKRNRDIPTEQLPQEVETSQQNRNYIKIIRSDEEASARTNTIYAKNSAAVNTNLKQSIQAAPLQRITRPAHEDAALMSPPSQLLNPVSKGREIIDLTSDDSPPGLQSKSRSVPHIQGSQGNAQEMSKVQKQVGGGDIEGRRHMQKSQTRQEYLDSISRHHPAKDVQPSGEVSSAYDVQTYSAKKFNNNKVPPQVQDSLSGSTIKKGKDEGYPPMKQETIFPKQDKKRHQQAQAENLEGRYTHSPSSNSVDEHFAEWFRRQASVPHRHPKSNVSHHIQSANSELGQFRYGYVSEDICAPDCSCSLPTSRKDEIITAVPPPKPKKEHYEEDLPFPALWSPSMVADHPDLYLSHPAHLQAPPDALASHMCTPSRIFIPTAQIFSPPYHMSMAPMAAPPLIASTDDQLHIHPHCLMASSYPCTSTSRTPDGTGYPLYSFT